MIHHGDCVEVMATLPADSVHAICTDPPYGLTFMGKDWDRLDGVDIRQPGDDTYAEGPGPYGRAKVRYGYGETGRQQQAWHYQWAVEAFRVLKPGGHLVAFGGTRTYHRLAAALEDAGFEIRDSILWAYAPTPAEKRSILEEWLAWSERVPSAGIRFHEPDGDSVAERVVLATSHADSPARALIAELASSDHAPRSVASCSAPDNAEAPRVPLSAHVTIAGSPYANREAPRTTDGFTVPPAAPVWLDASTDPVTKAAEALRIWRGSGPSSKRAATDALCAALTDALKHITCAHSATFRSYDTTWRTVCASATTVTTTVSMAERLLSFTVDTLARLDEGGDATEASQGSLAWIYGSGFP